MTNNTNILDNDFEYDNININSKTNYIYLRFRPVHRSSQNREQNKEKSYKIQLKYRRYREG